jgi:GNAT superfamily N-acetyltransferase
MPYHVRPATLEDLDALVHHRLSMFTDMGIAFDAASLSTAFAAWLRAVMPSGQYRAWVVEDRDERDARAGAAIVAGAGATIVPWPPGPQYPGDRLAFVYNVYTEHTHRRRGLARLLMEALHAWCRANGVTSIALNASEDGRPLYEAMGYAVTPSPMMFFALPGV